MVANFRILRHYKCAEKLTNAHILAEASFFWEHVEVTDESNEARRIRLDLLRKTIEQADLTVEQMIQIITASEPRVAAVSPEIEIARIQADSAKEIARLGGAVWRKEGVITGAVAAIATIITGYFTGFFGLQASLSESLSGLQATVVTQQGETARLLETQQGELAKLSQTNNFELRQIELNQRLAVVNQLLVIDPTSLGAVEPANEFEERAEKERKARICLLAAFGVLQIPEYVLGISPSVPKEYSAALNEFLEHRYQCTKNPVPSSSWKATSLPGGETARAGPWNLDPKYFSGYFELIETSQAGTYITATDLMFTDTSKREWILPAGTRVTGDAIPRSLGTMIGSPISGDFAPAFALYEHYSTTRERTSTETKQMLADAIIALGGSSALSRAIFASVAVFGPTWEFLDERN